VECHCSSSSSFSTSNTGKWLIHPPVQQPEETIIDGHQALLIIIRKHCGSKVSTPHQRKYDDAVRLPFATLLSSITMIAPVFQGPSPPLGCGVHWIMVVLDGWMKASKMLVAWRH